MRKLLNRGSLGDNASRAFNIASILHFKGNFNLTAMRNAVQQLVGRHEALRTRFSSNGEFQHVVPDLKIDIPLLDLSDLDVTERDQKLSKWIESENNKTFDLIKGPLLRVHIVKLTENHYALMLVTHHVVCDGSSFDILIKELRALYTSAVNGNNAQLPASTPFREFIKWQQEHENSNEGVASEKYWLKQCENAPPVVELPTVQSRPPIKTYRCREYDTEINPQLFSDVKRVSASNGCTVFATLLAVYKILLYRLTGQDDIIIGLAAAGQTVASCQNFSWPLCELAANSFTGRKRPILFRIFI